MSIKSFQYCFAIALTTLKVTFGLLTVGDLNLADTTPLTEVTRSLTQKLSLKTLLSIQQRLI